MSLAALREHGCVHGPTILARSLSMASIDDDYGNRWQYHSRSDRHSKIACWGILFDLLRTCALLREHAARGAVVFGINHEMRDFRNNRKKDLDLVISTPGTPSPKARKQESLPSLVAKYGVVLDPTESAELAKLPVMERGSVGSVHVALEAKAAMTAHVRALPRLFDELNSSHQTIHGATDLAIAAGFVMVNIADTFVSTDMNRFDMTKLAPRVSKHRQPRDAERVVSKVREIPRRTKVGEDGFDGLAIVLLRCRNDGSRVDLVDEPPAPEASDSCNYASMIRRVAQLYESRFPRI